MISIIVPVYKVEQCLARCIDSILAQSYRDWELILVDDGSPDRSGEICDEYASRDSRIRVIHQQNQGVSAARNRGLETAKGEYITFVDSDDYLGKEFLSSFELEDGADLQVQGMVSTYPDKGDQVLLPTVTIHRKMSVYEALSCSNNVKFLFSPWAKLFRTSILRGYSVLFPTDICYTEDEVFVKRFLMNTSLVRLFEHAHYYYTHESSAPLSGRDYSGVELYTCLSIENSTHRQMERRLGSIPQEYMQVYVRRKSFLVYRLLHKSIQESRKMNVDLIALVSELKRDYAPQLQYLGDLPQTYRLIRLVILYLPTPMAVLVIKMIIR